MRKQQNVNRCACQLCPGCGKLPKTNLEWGHIKLRFGWVHIWCHQCGSSWLAWHWLEDWTGITVRRARVLNPGGFSPTLLADLIVLETQHKRLSR